VRSKLKNLTEIIRKCADWINLTYERDKCRALVKTVMRNFLTEDQSASLRRFWFTEFVHFRLKHRNNSKLHTELNIFCSDTRSNS